MLSDFFRDAIGSGPAAIALRKPTIHQNRRNDIALSALLRSLIRLHAAQGFPDQT